MNTSTLMKLSYPYEINYPSWFRMLLGVGKMLDPELGIVGHFAPAAIYQQMAGNPEPEAIHAPQVRPPILADNATAVQIARYNSRQADYLREQLALSTLKTLILNSLDEATRTLIEDDTLGTAGLTVRNIVERLAELYGTATPEVFKAYVSRTLAPYAPPASLEEHINTHRLVHRHALDVGQPFNENQKVEKLNDTLAPCGVFTHAMKIYISTHPTFLQRTFNNFAQAMLTERNLSVGTTGSKGYASLMRSPATLTPEEKEAMSPDEKMDFLFAYMAKKWEPTRKEKKATREDRRSGGSSDDRPPSLTTLPSEWEYCFRHGQCKHKSIDCRDKKPGHQDHATYSNKMGGK